ncbi:MAG: L,D-transpeptidase family protein [Candidatus Portnoybacteria bacterium]|nr:L,D-transpeptidase family protein [Candidatus Portnoybacteria bacterium]
MFFRKIFVFLIVFSAPLLLFGKESLLSSILNEEKETPKLILVIIDEQIMMGYEYGKLKFSYSISSGVEEGLSPDHVLNDLGDCSTPRGRFSVFYKSEYHISSIYGDPMPWMLAFTRRGHCIHGGELPGYPASHGCVRLAGENAERVFYWADIGTVVLIVDSLK